MTTDVAALDGYFRRLGAVPLLNAAEEVHLAQAIEAGRAAESRLVALTDAAPAEMARLRHVVTTGVDARDRFITANLRLVARIAADMPRPGNLDLADMIQDGNAGLIRAVDGFDWRRGYRFSTYATWWIRQAIQRGTARSERIIPLPYALHQARLKVAASTSTLLARTGRRPTVEEITTATNLSPAMVRRVMGAPPDATSLQQRTSQTSDAWELEAVVAAEDAPAEEVVNRLTADWLMRAGASSLDDLSWRVVRMRYGLGGGEPMTYAELAERTGLGRETARKVVNRALVHLRELLAAS